MTHIFIKTWFVVSGASLAVAIIANYSLAQNVSGASVSVDETLGLEKSILTTDFVQKKTLITGGSQRGTNLFHSFYEFNVGKCIFFSPWKH
jgi:large exoprotein involved in heme utilization and adhesion